VLRSADVVQERGLPCTEESGHNGDRDS
jgi:hypothetical protein